ncbi:MAG: hypothetical protein K8R36_04155 [Planctomycetales bacterium]|nr:hypothetical protein [Planctomycetales bacterium]
MRDDREPGRSGAGVAILLVVVLFFLPALYVLSCGPAVALMTRGYISEEAIEVAYYPLSVASECSDWIASALEWYANLWAA